MNKAIFIDRDGVINKWVEPEDKDYGPNWYILDYCMFQFLPGVFDAFILMENLDYIPIIVSNQSCIGKGYVKYQAINQIFYLMHNVLSRHYCRPMFYDFCPHDTDQNCACRKPSPGMLYKAAIEHDIVLEDSWIIGDSGSDIRAGANAGIPGNHRILIKEYDYGYKGSLLAEIPMTQSLLQAIKHIMACEDGQSQ